MKDLRSLNYFLGLEVTSSSNGFMSLNLTMHLILFPEPSLIDSMVTSTILELNVHLAPIDGTLLYEIPLDIANWLSSLSYSYLS